MSNKNMFGEPEVKVVSSCPICKTTQDQLEAKILGEDAETKLFHITCQKCSNSLLALVLVSRGGISSVGLLTDLSYDDVLQFGQSATVGINDVILAHQAVANPNFLGNFTTD